MEMDAHLPAQLKVIGYALKVLVQQQVFVILFVETATLEVGRHVMMVIQLIMTGNL